MTHAAGGYTYYVAFDAGTDGVAHKSAADITMSRPIESWDDVMEVRQHLIDSSDFNQVVISNYILLKFEPVDEGFSHKIPYEGEGH